MNALALCVVAFATSLWAGKRSLGEGLVAMLFWGYFYGILRANLLTSFSHFIFDAALIGLVIAQWNTLTKPDERTSTLRAWIVALIAWPTVLLLAPFQPFLISLVGFRGCVFFIPLALLGSRMVRSDVFQLSRGLAVLNLLALGFAVAEYFLGIERFFPVSPVTTIIYLSSDVAGGFYRIPGTFGTSHLYGGTMVSSVPFLVAGWSNERGRFARLLTVCGLAAALLGVLFSATRLNFLLCSVMVTITILGGRINMRTRVVFLIVILAVLVVALKNERFQRFKSLSDTDYVGERISGSVNHTFWQILSDYPFGNGLGGGGTSIPYFLQGDVRNPIGMENEYARILSEQGIIGLLIWLGFLLWYVGRLPSVLAPGPWAVGRRMAWLYCVIEFGTGWIGLGLLTAIPASAMLLLTMGWTAVPVADAAPARRRPAPSAVGAIPSYRPVPIP